MKHAVTVVIVCLATLWSVGTAAGEHADWPQWRGPERTGKSGDTGLLDRWPEGGPALVWSSRNLGEAYGSISVSGNRIFLQGTQDGSSAIFCLKREDGSIQWIQSIGKSLDDRRGGGPRGTPTVDGDRLYVLTEAGDLACLRVEDGSRIWSRNILRDFKARNIRWHISESPLIEGGDVIVTPGGPGATLVALDKESGETRWTSSELSDKAGYSSCVAAEAHGVRFIATLTGNAAVGVRARDGKLLWRNEKVANRTANVTTPIINGDQAFYSSAYGTGCLLLKLKPKGELLEAEEVYFNRNMMNHHGGLILHEGHVYGFSNSILTCLNLDTGEVVWKDRSVGKGSLTYADGRLYLLGEKYRVALAAATPSGYLESGRFTIGDQERPSWAHPVVVDGRLYLRNQGMLTVYDVRAE